MCFRILRELSLSALNHTNGEYGHDGVCGMMRENNARNIELKA
jgi:hypothetical protein